MRAANSALFFCVVALLGLGVVMVCSAGTGEDGAGRLIMQPVWSALGLLVCGLAVLCDYRWLRRHPWLVWMIYGLAFVLLVLVLIPGIGTNVNGARRWIRVGGLSLQPSEFAKLALILAVAMYADRNQRRMERFWRGLVVPLLLIGGLAGLVFVEPDVGTALLMGAVGGGVMLVAGVRWRYFLPCVLAGMMGLLVFLYHNPVRSGRIYAWLHPEETKYGLGMQVYNSRLAFGSGGLTGVGLGDGRQKLGFVPEHETDFILSVIGEELGLVATLSVVLAFTVVLICGVIIAGRARDLFGMLTAAGITLLISFQAVINIGVVTGALPNKGLSLPFISYGGSNLVMLLAGVGILLNIGRRNAGRQRTLTGVEGGQLALPIG